MIPPVCCMLLRFRWVASMGDWRKGSSRPTCAAPCRLEGIEKVRAELLDRWAERVDGSVRILDGRPGLRTTSQHWRPRDCASLGDGAGPSNDCDSCTSLKRTRRMEGLGERTAVAVAPCSW